MRIFFPYVFLFSFCLGSTEIDELLKIPILLQHYLEHKEANNKLSFNDFIQNHYAQKDDGDNDKSKDEQLPYKSNNFLSNLHAKDSKITTQFYFLIFVEQEISPNSLLDLQAKLPSVNLTTLLQPPRHKA